MPGSRSCGLWPDGCGSLAASCCDEPDGCLDSLSESSEDDIVMTSGEQVRLARKSIRRVQKREQEQIKRKEKNKISMEDYLKKQTEFKAWLIEEQNKNKFPSDLPSNKLKIYFKKFIKKWNKRKLPMKYYNAVQYTGFSSDPPSDHKRFSFAEDIVICNPIHIPLQAELYPTENTRRGSPFYTFGKAIKESDKTASETDKQAVENRTSSTDRSLVQPRLENKMRQEPKQFERQSINHPRTRRWVRANQGQGHLGCPY